MFSSGFEKTVSNSFRIDAIVDMFEMKWGKEIR